MAAAVAYGILLGRLLVPHVFSVDELAVGRDPIRVVQAIPPVDPGGESLLLRDLDNARSVLRRTAYPRVRPGCPGLGPAGWRSCSR